MRRTLFTLAVLTAVAGVVFACGSTTQSEFAPPPPSDPLGTDPNPNGDFGNPDGGAAKPTCTPQTCTTAKANCGPIGDGCGGIVQCGTCTGEETCGGGGVGSNCGKPACTPKTCAELGATCGPVGDGCGGVLSSCGTCNTAAGEICGGGGPSRCGTGLPNTVDGGAACGCVNPRSVFGSCCRDSTRGAGSASSATTRGRGRSGCFAG